MPVIDEEGRVVGSLFMELRETGSYLKVFMVVDFGTHKIRLYPLEAEELSDLSQVNVIEEINCQYITKVAPASSRPKVLNCFEMGTTTSTYFFSVDCLDERNEWMETLKKSSMRHCSAKQLVTLQKKTPSYQTKVVGGRIMRTPIPEQGSECGSRKDDSKGAQGQQQQQQHHSGGDLTSSLNSSSCRKTRGYPRVLKAGHGIKLGAVMKSWKRRFFVLTEICLGYYKSIDEIDPIKTVSVSDISRVVPSREAIGKDDQHMFEVVTPGRTFYIQVDTLEELQEWVKVFNDLLRTQRGSRRSSKNEAPLSDRDEDDDFGTPV